MLFRSFPDKWKVIYFYPKDFTSVCGSEVEAFARLAKDFADRNAVLLGGFNRFKLVPGHDRGYSLKTVVDWFRSQTKTPVYTGLPFGHVPTKVLLPVGRTVDFAVEGRNALIYWGHLGHGHDAHDHGH